MSETHDPRDWIEQMRTRAMVAGQCSVEGPETTASRMAAAEADFLMKCVFVWSAEEARHAEELATLRAQLAAVRQALDAAAQDIWDWVKTARGLRERSANPDFDPNVPHERGIAESERVLETISAALASPSTPEPQTCEWRKVPDAWLFQPDCKADAAFDFSLPDTEVEHFKGCPYCLKPLVLSPDQPTEVKR